MTRIDTATRVVAAPQAAVFAALVDAYARSRWLPPTGMSGHFETFDARPGGGYRMVLAYDDPTAQGKSEANTDVVEVRFAEIEPRRRVVEEVGFVSDDPRFSGTMTMTWTIEPDADGTRVTVAARDVPEGISKADHEPAMASTLANLDAYVHGSQTS